MWTLLSLPAGGGAQAMDRCHRIGQTRPVLVLRLASAGSVEGKMLARAGCPLPPPRFLGNLARCPCETPSFAAQHCPAEFCHAAVAACVLRHVQGLQHPGHMVAHQA